MSRFGTTDYNPSSGSSGDSNDYVERESILLDKYAILSAELNNVGIYQGQFGLNMILNFDGAEVVEGVVTNRVENADGEQDDKTKIMGWDRWYDRDEEMNLVPFDEEDGITTDELGRRVTEEHGGDTYKYEIEEGLLEGRDDPAELGDVEIWLGNGKKARTLAKVLSSHGHDIIDDKDDDNEWLDAETDDEFALREELEGREILLWYEQTTLTPDDVDSLDEEVTFTDSVVLDAETDAPITIPNDADGDGGGDSGGSDTSEDADTGDSESGGDDELDLPDDVEELVDMFARTGQDDRGSVEETIVEEAPDDYDVDMDAVMEEIRSRM